MNERINESCPVTFSLDEIRSFHLPTPPHQGASDKGRFMAGVAISLQDPWEVLPGLL